MPKKTTRPVIDASSTTKECVNFLNARRALLAEEIDEVSMLATACSTVAYATQVKGPNGLLVADLHRLYEDERNRLISEHRHITRLLEAHSNNPRKETP